MIHAESGRSDDFPRDERACGLNGQQHVVLYAYDPPRRVQPVRAGPAACLQGDARVVSARRRRSGICLGSHDCWVCVSYHPTLFVERTSPPASLTVHIHTADVPHYGVIALFFSEHHAARLPASSDPSDAELRSGHCMRTRKG